MLPLGRTERIQFLQDRVREVQRITHHERLQEATRRREEAVSVTRHQQCHGAIRP